MPDHKRTCVRMRYPGERLPCTCDALPDELRNPRHVMQERLLYLIAFAVVVLALLFATHGRDLPLWTGAGDAECAVEDEVMVEVVEDSYGIPAGRLFCVHVDTLKPNQGDAP